MPFSFKPTQSGENIQTEKTETSSIPLINTKADANAIQPIMPLGTMNLGDRIEKMKIGWFQLILYMILGFLIFLAVVLFGYRQYLISKIDGQKKVLEDQDKTLGEMNLEQIKALSNRIKVVSQTLNEHTSVSTAFRILEKSIENPVTYKGFELTKNNINKNYDLKVFAVAPSYRSIAQQIDTFYSDEYKKDYVPAISYDNISLDNSGEINFTLKMAFLIQGKLPENVLSTETTPTIPETGILIPVATSTPVTSFASSTVVNPLTATSTRKITASTTPN